jgi:hypothetical protein
MFFEHTAIPPFNETAPEMPVDAPTHEMAPEMPVRATSTPCLDETASSTGGHTASEAPCPYTHINTQPVPPPTTPRFETIALTDIGNQALLAHAPEQNHRSRITAIADSGASHALIRESHSHFLTRIERCRQDQPFVVFKAANGAVLHAIGRGRLTVAKLTVTAYLFRDSELAHDLLGLIPFSNLGCTMTFQPHLFCLYARNAKTAIIMALKHFGRLTWNNLLSNPMK